MPIRAFIQDTSFDPEAIEVLNTAYLGVCSDLGLTDRSDGATEMVAKRVIELAKDTRDPERLRAAVLASFRTGDASYARSELRAEDLAQQSIRVSSDVRDLVARTRDVIDDSRQCLSAADRSLKSR